MVRRTLVNAASVATLVLALAPSVSRGDGHAHHVSAYLGGTTLFNEHATSFTFGVDYEYAMTHALGIGFVAERAVGDVRATSVFAVADVHVTRGLVLQVGPGVEFVHGHEYFAGRFGGYYEMAFGETTVAPSIFYDLSEHDDALVYGLIVGRRF